MCVFGGPGWGGGGGGLSKELVSCSILCTGEVFNTFLEAWEDWIRGV